MTKYLSREPFSVGGGNNKAYGDGWDRIFGKKPKELTEEAKAAVKADVEAIYGGVGQPIADPIVDELLKDMTFGQFKVVCPECAGSGVVEDDATGAMGYVVNRLCPVCSAGAQGDSGQKPTQQ